MSIIIEQTPAELMDAITHEELATMYIELRQTVGHMEKQVERLYTYATAMKMENESLRNRYEGNTNDN